MTTTTKRLASPGRRVADPTPPLSDRDAAKANAFRKLEDGLLDAGRMAEIAYDQVTDVLHDVMSGGGRLGKDDYERAIFAVGHVMDMLGHLRIAYYAGYQED